MVQANGFIRDPKLELESSHFTFDLVPLSYKSVDVVVRENWLLRHKAEMVCHKKVVKMPWSCKVRVGSNGNLWWEASVLLGRKKGGVRVTREDDREVTEGREDVREFFQQRGSGAKRKLSRCGRNQMGNEPILALLEGADDFVVSDVSYIEVEVDYQAWYGKESRLHLWRVTERVIEWIEIGTRNNQQEVVIQEMLEDSKIVVRVRLDAISQWGYYDNRALSSKELFLGEDATRAIPNMGFNLVDVEGELTLSSLDVLQGFSFFLQMGFTLILATLDGLDVGLLGDVIGEDDCDDDG
ncbi:hypothetical protein Tco_0320094 [Tanacetum coccineum]